MRKIRLLTFSTLYPSGIRPGHGIFVETRLRELLKTGAVEACVVAPVPWFFSRDPRYGEWAKIAATPKEETRNGIRVLHPRYLLPPKIGMNIAPLSMALSAVPLIKRLVRSGYDFDVIDAHYYYPDGVAAALLGWYFKRPVTITARGSDVNLISRYFIPKKFMLWAGRRAHKCIGVSQALVTAMSQMGVSPAKLTMIPNGVDAEKFSIHEQSRARVELKWSDIRTLVMVGNLVENKGQKIAICAMPLLPDWQLFLIGHGPDRSALERLSLELGVSARVTFLGAVDQSYLAKCYSAADILVLPSSREGWPNVLLEAMACGTPVVATRVGGIPEIVTSATAGCLMEGQTAQALATAVSELWRNLPSRADVRAIALSRGWGHATGLQLGVFRAIVEPNKPVVSHA